MNDELLEKLNYGIERLLVGINELNITTKSLDNTLKTINDEYNFNSKEEEINLMNGGYYGECNSGKEKGKIQKKTKRTRVNSQAV